MYAEESRASQIWHFFPKAWVQGFNFARGHLLFITISVSRTVPEVGLSLMECFVNVVLVEMALMM